MTCLIHRILFVVTILAWAPMGWAQDAGELFDQLFGAKIAEVKKTFAKVDDVALAKELMATASEASEQPKLLEKICLEAYALASTSGEGYPTALEAMALLGSKVPDQKRLALENQIKLRQKIYRSAKRSDKPIHGDGLINDLLAMGHLEAGETKFLAATTQFRLALNVATSIRSERLDQIKGLLTQLQEKKKVNDRITLLKNRLKANKNDQAAVHDMVMLYLVELQKPNEARKYTFLLKDEALKKVVTLSNAKPDELTPEGAMALADFYHDLAKKPTTANKAGAYRSALAYYTRFRKLSPEAKGLTAMKAKITVTNIEKWLKANNEPLVATQTPVHGGGSAALAGALPMRQWVDVSPHWIAMSSDLDIPLPITNSVRKGDAVRLSVQKLWISHVAQVGVLPQGGYRFQITFGGEGDAFQTNIRLPMGRSHHVIVELSQRAMEIEIPGTNPGSRFPQPLSGGKKYLAEFRVTPQGDQYRLQGAINNKAVLDWISEPGKMRRTAGLNLIEFGLQRNSASTSSPMVFSKPKLYVTSGLALAKTYRASLAQREKEAPGIYHQRRIYVSPTTPWTIAGKVLAGKTYNMQFGNYWRTQQGGSTIRAGGDAEGKYYLQAKIGPNSKPVKIGNLTSFKSPKSGVLYVGMATEKPEDMWDNNYYIDFKIQQEGAPSAPTVRKPTDPIQWRSVSSPIPANRRWTVMGKVKAGVLYDISASQPYTMGVYTGTKIPGEAGYIGPLGREGKYVLVARVAGGKPFPIWTGKSSADRRKYVYFDKDGVLEIGITDSHPKLTGYLNANVRAVDMVSHIRGARNYQVRQYHYYKRNAD